MAKEIKQLVYQDSDKTGVLNDRIICTIVDMDILDEYKNPIENILELKVSDMSEDSQGLLTQLLDKLTIKINE